LYKSHMGNVFDLQGSHFLVIKKTLRMTGICRSASGFWSACPLQHPVSFRPGLFAEDWPKGVAGEAFADLVRCWAEQMGTALGLVLAVADVGGAG
jgi:hypothetical protein